MTEWKAKRFWDNAAVSETDGGFGVGLDGRPVRSPAKTPLIVPTLALAEEIAAEWQAQHDVIDPRSMPFTRSANAALDKVAPQFEEVAGLIADYGGTDLLCYRADHPQELIDRQAAQWDPVLDWAAVALGVRLRVGTGVMHVSQDQAALDRLAAQVRVLDPFRLTAFHDLVGLSGSLILGFAVTEGFRGADEAWSLSRIDEKWQAEKWGEDEEAADIMEAKRLAFLHAARFFALCG